MTIDEAIAIMNKQIDKARDTAYVNPEKDFNEGYFNGLLYSLTILELLDVPSSTMQDEITEAKDSADVSLLLASDLLDIMKKTQKNMEKLRDSIEDITITLIGE